MDKIAQYRKILKELVESYARYKPANVDVTMSPVVDTTYDHYGVLMVGWDKDKRFEGFVLHVDLIDGKIWVQYDGTDIPGVVDALEEAGIPKEDIVLGFHPPNVRQYTDYALG